MILFFYCFYCFNQLSLDFTFERSKPIISFNCATIFIKPTKTTTKIKLDIEKILIINLHYILTTSFASYRHSNGFCIFVTRQKIVDIDYSN